MADVKETVKPESLLMKRTKEKIEKRNARLQSQEKDERNRKLGLVK